MVKIETERLRFRALLPEDVDNLQKIFSDSVAMEFYPGTKSIEETLQWIEWNRESYSDNGFGLWALLDKTSENFIGQCGLILQRNVEGIDEVEIGYLLVRQYWGRGFAIEAASACRDFAFSKLGCKSVISLINPKNVASIRVAERNGMVFEKNIERWGKQASVYRVTPF